MLFVNDGLQKKLASESGR